ncbi:MAG TPA: preprotein translocase subunit SecA [Pyrinomonadaceae bacterium]|jgi:preprotein translocase subunit SecA|nr:preprotein translocase subunit SecA [Pyrinomonadaceae bacterium]
MSFDKFLTKIFGSNNQRFLKTIQPTVDTINSLEPALQKLSDDQLKARTADFKERVQKAVGDTKDKEERKKREREILDELLPEAFATVREASVRTTGMRHFDVQLIGGMVLHQGKIAEMRTGEGKTLVATLPSYLNALTGRGGVHVVTVNDYLASRDAEWMGQIHRFLGLEVGCIQNDMDDFERQAAYAADITYGTNNEFGFDYLRDNMKFDLATCVQRGHYFAVVDEVDSILIDEARTPLIISGPSDEATDKYKNADAIIPHLKRGEEDAEGKKTGDYVVDEKAHTAVLTEEGVDKAERLLGVGNLYDPSNMELLHCVEQALKAHTLYRLDHQYVVQDGEVIIVDDFTGRLMKGRRWSDGLHQAVEAKEGVEIEKENQTLATITLQNYFRLYEKLSGMTGTAETEAAEFNSTYKLDVVVIPTHMPMIRVDASDVIYRTLPEKWDAVIEEIKECYEKGQPALVGTVSVENSELIARRLVKEAVPHNVLNAKYHEREAEIVAQAGRRGSVTIATNMAGRGTDILLGGNPDFMAREFLKQDEVDPDEATEDQWQVAFIRAKRIVEDEHKQVVGLGGLHIIGTERHESRRIDNQLRGRAGRQGDPGSSRFFLSLEDDLMRIFAGDKVKALMQRLGMEKGVAIESKMVSKRIAAAQKSVEGRNFEARKHLLEYDDVMNKQRETIYGLRRQLMEEPDQREYLMGDPPSAGVAYDLLSDITKQYLNPEVSPDDWEVENYKIQIKSIYDFDADTEGVDIPTMTSQEVTDTIWEKLKVKYARKEEQIGMEAMRTYERIIMLNIIDAQWKDHLLSLDHLKQGIGLVGYGQKDPLVEYKKQSFDLFQEMLDRIDTTTIRSLFNLQIVSEEPPEAAMRARRPPRRPPQLNYTGPNQGAAPAGEEAGKIKTVVRDQPKVGRNEQCPCGSGKKYKKCHGINA